MGTHSLERGSLQQSKHLFINLRPARPAAGWPVSKGLAVLVQCCAQYDNDHRVVATQTAILPQVQLWKIKKIKRFVADAGGNQLHGRETGEMNVYFSLSTVTTKIVKKKTTSHSLESEKKGCCLRFIFFITSLSLFSPKKSPTILLFFDCAIYFARGIIVSAKACFFLFFFYVIKNKVFFFARRRGLCKRRQWRKAGTDEVKRNKIK